MGATPGQAIGRVGKPFADRVEFVAQTGYDAWRDAMRPLVYDGQHTLSVAWADLPEDSRRVWRKIAEAQLTGLDEVRF
jgi:hypothetical protein